LLPDGTPHVGTTDHTKAVTAQTAAILGIGPTLEAVARIPETHLVETEPARRTRAGLAGTGDAITADTALVSGTFDILTGVDALPVLAPLSGAAVHVVARAEAQTLAASLTLTAVSVPLA
jgi:hypothetical protein